MKKRHCNQESSEDDNKENIYTNHNDYKELTRQYRYNSNHLKHIPTTHNEEKLKYSYDTHHNQQSENRPYRITLDQRQVGHLQQKKSKKTEKHQNQQNHYTDQRFKYHQKKKYHNDDPNNHKDKEIASLKEELTLTQNKLKQFKQKTINEQIQVLNQLEALQEKFAMLKKQKEHLQKILQGQAKKRITLYSQQIFTEPEDIMFAQCQQNRQKTGFWKEKYQQLLQQHKKIKGIGTALVDMMIKVEGKSHQQIFRGIETEEKEQFKDAWRWVKNVVRQYESIRGKALQWKQVYDKYKDLD